VEKQAFFGGFYSNADGSRMRGNTPLKHFSKLGVTVVCRFVAE